MKVVFFGSSRYVVPVLEMIHDQFDLPLVVTTEQNKMDAVPFYCESKKIEYLTIRKSADLISNYQIEETMANIGIVADFGILIPVQLMNVFPYGIINIHPSLLPKYRGPTPVQNAILNGETETGVTIIKLDKYLDHGPVVAQIGGEKINENDTAKSLYERLFKSSAPLLLIVLNKFEHNNIVLSEQNHNLATFTKILTREDGYFDYKNQQDLTKFDNFIRAYYPWPGAWTKAKLHSQGDEKIVKFLPGQKVQVEGGKEMEYKDLINGYAQAESTFLDFLRKGLISG